MIAEAKDRFYNTNDVDSLLNVVEAPQLVDSMRDLGNTLESSGVQASLRKGVRFDAKRALKGSKGIAGAFLAWSFGLAPLINDMRKVQSSVRTLRLDMRRARAREGKPVTIHLSQKGYCSNPSSEGHIAGTLFDRYLETLSTPTQVVCVKGIRTAKYNSESFSSLGYLMNKFGAVGPASYAWERIPFSFVVDWFVDLRDVTNQLDNLLTGNTKRISDISFSQKIHMRRSCVHNNNYMPGYYVDDSYNGMVMCSSEIKSYHREALRNDLVITGSGRFGKKQASLTAALLYQKVANLVAKVARR
jgi:hypothetical protein